MVVKSHWIVGLGLCLALGACGDDGDGGGTDGTGSSTSTSSTTGGDVTSTTTDDTTTSSTTDDSTTSSTTTGDGSTGSTGLATGSTGDASMPDIDMTLVKTQMEASAYTERLNFPEDSCAIEEACIDAAGDRRVLRFSTITPNVGVTDFVVGSPDLDPDSFEFGKCHGHWHFKDFAAYRLLDLEGNVVATGHKMAFALIDLAKWDPDAGDEQYPTGDGVQGISVGWADVYNAGLDCQWIDVTDVPNGDYVLEVSINPAEQVAEMSYVNNIVNLDITIDDNDGPPPTPEEWTCDDGYYNAFDGCDCGCGAFDPDCQNPTADACEYCDNSGSCASSCDDISANNNAVCG